jgi:hypothetical protein
MPKKNLTSQQKWDQKNRTLVRESKAKYDKENPVWAFRPSKTLRNWLEESRGISEKGKPETNAAIVLRKLEKLMKIEKDEI